MLPRTFYCLSILLACAVFFPRSVFADTTSTIQIVYSNTDATSAVEDLKKMIDTDGDGLSDDDENRMYHTDPLKADSDDDTFGDGYEVTHGYSPLVAGKKLSEIDTDSDGLTDAAEIALRTDLNNEDSDADGFSDGLEVFKGYDPRTKEAVQRKKTLIVHLKPQQLEYQFDGVEIGRVKISSGKATTPTPIGTFTIAAKRPKAWSASAKLWMPWWMNFVGKNASAGKYALHELPEWPNGKKEGAAHLGIPVSHGCVRLGVGEAKSLYDWTPIGTQVIVSKL